MTDSTQAPSPAPKADPFFGPPEYIALAIGTLLGVVPILQFDLFVLGGQMLALPLWGGLFAAAFVLMKARRLSPAKGFVIGMMIGLLATGLRFGIARADLVESFANSPRVVKSHEAWAETERKREDYEKHKQVIEDRIVAEKVGIPSRDWKLGIAYGFYGAIALALLGATAQFMQQRRRRF
jgi:hypothetical protein